MFGFGKCTDMPYYLCRYGTPLPPPPQPTDPATETGESCEGPKSMMMFCNLQVDGWFLITNWI